MKFDLPQIFQIDIMTKETSDNLKRFLIITQAQQMRKETRRKEEGKGQLENKQLKNQL